MKAMSVLLVGVVLVAACGGDDDDVGVVGADEADAVGTTTIAIADADADTDTDADSGADTESGDDGAGGGDAGDETFSGDAGSTWCVRARALEERFDAFDEAMFLDPVELEALMGELTTEIAAAAEVAPPELVDAMETYQEGIGRFDAALADADYSALDVDLTVLEELDDEMTAAGDRITAYNEDVCGIPADDTGDDATDAAGDESADDSFDAGEGTIREQVVAELVASGFTEDEANCILDEIDLTDPAAMDDMNAVLEVFDACGIDLERLAELGG